MHRRRRPASVPRRHAVLPAVLLFFVAGAGGDPTILATVCGTTPAANPESFDVSFVNTLELIYQNVTRSGFGAASSGAGADAVYGLGQCLAYVSPTDCQLCYATSRVKLPHCLPANAGRIYLDGCFLRYGPESFAAAAADAGDTAVCSNDTAPAPARGFAASAAALLRNVTAAAGERHYAAAGGAGAYAAAQCWRSLNASACAACVASARDRVLSRCLPAAAEGYGLNAGCVVRYSTRPFYLPANGAGGSSSEYTFFFDTTPLRITMFMNTAFASLKFCLLLSRQAGA
jgi:hypothetical protein